MRQSDSALTGIDKLLDSGRDGLKLFATFIPRYKSWTGGNPPGGDVDALTSRYDQQRGMDVEPLRAIGTTISEELAGSVGDGIRLQQLRLGELPAHWSDSPAADNAAQLVQRVNGQVGTERDNLSGIAQALSAAADQLENIVRTKADAVRTDLATDTLAGKNGDQIDRIIACARGQFGGATSPDEQRTKVWDLLPEIGDTDDPAAYAERWLDEVFVPTLDGKITAFTALTDATDTAVSGVYDLLAAALEAVGTSPYTSPNGQPSAATELAACPPTVSASQALFTGMPLGGTSVAATAPAAASAASATIGLDAYVPVESSDSPVSALTGTTGQLSMHGVPIAAAAPASQPANPAEGGQKKDDTGQPGAPTTTGGLDQSGGSADPSEPSAPADPVSTPAPTSVTDMGKVGEWRPGDIANVLTATSQITGKAPDILTHIGDPLKAVGETAKDFGEAFKSVVGTEGITGLVKEGLDAVERIDKLVDHHMHPGEVTEQPSDPASSTDTTTATPGNGTPKPASAQGDPQGDSVPIHGAAHPAGVPQSGTPENNPSADNEGKSIPGTPAAQAAATPTVSAAAATTTPNASSAMSPAGFFGGAHGSPARSEGDGEHRPKIQYVAPVVQDEPDFVDEDQADSANVRTDGPGEPDQVGVHPDGMPSDTEDSEVASAVEGVRYP